MQDYQKNTYLRLLYTNVGLVFTQLSTCGFVYVLYLSLRDTSLDQSQRKERVGGFSQQEKPQKMRFEKSLLLFVCSVGWEPA